ncbi:MAG: GNAT family N-acetyltransferase [Acidimicrobiales bacterium]
MIIESPHLLLRALTAAEAEEIVTEDRTGRSWAPDYPTPPDVGIAAIALAGRAAFASDEMPWGLFVIVDKSDGLNVGGIGFKGTPNERREVEIGYGICPSRQGHGVATEALNALCDFVGGRVGAIVAETDGDNIASQRVLEKCGFQRDGGSDDLLRWRREV